MKVKGLIGIPDLQTQLESLLDQVWRSEAEWLLWDRIDAAVKLDLLREQRPIADTASDTRQETN